MGNLQDKKWLEQWKDKHFSEFSILDNNLPVNKVNKQIFDLF